MSLTRTVPDLLPFDFHSSWPWTPSLAAKNSLPPTAVREAEELPWSPGVMSLTRTVPDVGAVRLPQLLAVDAVVGGEEQPSRRQRSGTVREPP